MKPNPHDKKNSSQQKILLVDDEPLSCEVTVDILELIECEADVVNNGLQALDVYDYEKYKLILMDCEMPVMDGFSAANQLRLKEKEMQSASIPIIAITGHSASDIREKCIANGMNDVLSKPFSMLELHTMVKKWL